jgi:hypothetical protein
MPKPESPVMMLERPSACVVRIICSITCSPALGVRVAGCVLQVRCRLKARRVVGLGFDSSHAHTAQEIGVAGACLIHTHTVVLCHNGCVPCHCHVGGDAETNSLLAPIHNTRPPRARARTHARALSPHTHTHTHTHTRAPTTDAARDRDSVTEFSRETLADSLPRGWPAELMLFSRLGFEDRDVSFLIESSSQLVALGSFASKGAWCTCTWQRPSHERARLVSDPVDTFEQSHFCRCWRLHACVLVYKNATTLPQRPDPPSTCP